MATTSLATARVRVGQELDLGIFIPNANFDAAVAGSITSAFYLRNTNWGGNQFSQWGIFRPTAATAADSWRWADLLTNTTGLLTHSGANYADITVGTETLELWNYPKFGIRPDVEFLNAANRALEWIYFPTAEPLSDAPDAAMRETALASWGTLVNATAAKQSTASRVFSGIQSLAVTNTLANGYQPTAAIRVTPGESIVVGAISRRQSGTGPQLICFGQTNGALYTAAIIGTAITHVASTWQFMWMNVTIPTGCVAIEVRLGGVGASDVTDWDSLWVYRPNSRERIYLPSSYADERFKLDALTYSPFHVSNPNSNGVYQAYSVDPYEIPAEDYGSAFANPEANPDYVQFHNRAARKYATWPMWIQMRLPYSERGLFGAETSTTTAPAHLLYAAIKVELLKVQSVRDRVTNGEKLYQDCLKMLTDAQRVRVVEGPAERTRPWRMARV